MIMYIDIFKINYKFAKKAFLNTKSNETNIVFFDRGYFTNEIIFRSKRLLKNA